MNKITIKQSVGGIYQGHNPISKTHLQNCQFALSGSLILIRFGLGKPLSRQILHVDDALVVRCGIFAYRDDHVYQTSHQY